MTGTKQHYVIKPGILAGSCVECVYSTTGGRLRDRKQTCPGICNAPGSGIWNAQRPSSSGDNRARHSERLSQRIVYRWYLAETYESPHRHA